jgi:hypothetical protein
MLGGRRNAGEPLTEGSTLTRAKSIDENRPGTLEQTQTWGTGGGGPLLRSRSLYRARSDSATSERPRAVLQRKHASVLPPMEQQSRAAAASISSGSTTSSLDWARLRFAMDADTCETYPILFPST